MIIKRSDLFSIIASKLLKWVVSWRNNIVAISQSKYFLLKKEDFLCNCNTFLRNKTSYLIIILSFKEIRPIRRSYTASNAIKIGKTFKVRIKCDINAMCESKQNLMRSSSNNLAGYTEYSMKI